MEPRPVTREDEERYGMWKHTFLPPKDMDDVASVEVLTSYPSEEFPLTMIPWTMNEIELAHLAQGGTLWLVIMGRALAPVALEVEPRTS